MQDQPLADADILPRAYGRSLPVTPWRQELARRADEIALLIAAHAEPEARYAVARELAEDIVHTISTELRQTYGRVFDSLIDGRAA